MATDYDFIKLIFTSIYRYAMQGFLFVLWFEMKFIKKNVYFLSYRLLYWNGCDDNSITNFCDACSV